ncbi:MAG: hypothetical protein WC273_06665 [Dehalococcoidia bacterium]
MANFEACDLCYRSLSVRLVDIQISPATLVQISDEGDVAHRTRGLRDYRLCDHCGGFLLEVMREMTRAARAERAAHVERAEGTAEGAA